MNKPNLHLLNLPHTSTTKDFVSCAYTQRNLKFATMMTKLGYKVYLYGGPENEADCEEHIVVASEEEQKRWFGEFDYHNNFYPITWGPEDAHWVEMNNNIIREMSKRIQPKDIICITAGLCQKQVADAFPDYLNSEIGIGYSGIFSDYKVFESYPHMHWLYGCQGTDNGGFYDAVIPNFFVPEDFVAKDPTAYGDNDYIVFLGRWIQRKGPEIAIQISDRLGIPLIMAGQGVESQVVHGDGSVTVSGGGLSLTGKNIKHIGSVNEDQRANLLTGAKACIMATTYLEPFGGVSIEALMCGTPVIATDFGVFSSTIPHGLAGYRFRTIGEAVQFTSDEYLDKLDHNKIKRYAIDNFSTDRVALLYDDYFMQLMGLYEDGFYTDKGCLPDRYTIYT